MQSKLQVNYLRIGRRVAEGERERGEPNEISIEKEKSSARVKEKVQLCRYSILFNFKEMSATSEERYCI